MAYTIKKFNLTPEEYPVVQDYFPGTGYGVEMLYNNGKLRAKFVHKRIREYPISGGPSTVRISTKNKSNLNDNENVKKNKSYENRHSVLDQEVDLQEAEPEE